MASPEPLAPVGADRAVAPPRAATGEPLGAALRWGSRTHTGLVRPHNEDSLLVGPAVLAVADGMGGHAAGEVASRLAVETLADALGADVLAPGVTAAVRSANRAIIAASRTSESLVDMGTTVTGLALLADGSGILVFNVGDSRVYALHAGVLEQVTRDHSVVAELVASGALEPEMAGQHPERNVVTRALGVVGEVDVDSWLVTPTIGDRWLLCSDGLSNEVTPAAMLAVLTSTPSPTEACRLLVDLALEHGARDNVTVVVADVVLPGLGGQDGAPTAPAHVPGEFDTQPRPTVLTEVPGVARAAPTLAPPPPLEDVPIFRPTADSIPSAGPLITDVPGQGA